MERKSLKKMSEDDEDRLSGLPEPILDHIFSFLDMKDVVRISLLSRIWRYKWISVPCLNFDHKLWKVDFKEQNQHIITCKDRFMKFVDNVLFLRDNSNIHKFSLSSSYYCNIGRINTWITVVVRRQVQELHLYIATEQPLELPHFLFTSAIRVFKLQANMRTSIRLPNSMCSAFQLKILELVCVQLPEGNSDGELLLNCPNLEILIMKYCHNRNLELLNISALQLQSLVLEDNSCLNRSITCKIRICTPNLASFQFDGPMNGDFAVDNFSNLVTVETLVLSGAWLQIFSKIPPISKRMSTPFHNLRYLKLTELRRSSSIQVVLNLLERSPYIENLVLELKEMAPNTRIESADWGVHLSFHCMFNHLKFVEIQNLEGCKNDLKFLEFLLKNAMALQNITITTIKALSSDKEKELANFSKTLQLLPRASLNVSILFLLKSRS